MSTKLRILVSTLLSFVLVYILLDLTTASYAQTFATWTPLLTIAFLLPLSLYSNPCKAVIYNGLELSNPPFAARSILRRKIGSYGFFISTISVLVGILLLPERYILLVSPFMYLMPLSGYFLATNECFFCAKFNAPKEKCCINCGYPLNKINYIRFKKHI